MIRHRIVAALLAAALVTDLPASAMAQELPSGLEATTWKLTGYPEGEDVAAVPFGISATLRLDDGRASGSGGCNTFSGSYRLDGPGLALDDGLATTLKICGGDVQAVEDAYLAALPEVRSWFLGDGALELRDAVGDTLLTFEVPSVSLTASEVAGLAAILEGLRSEIAGLRRDMERLNVDRLRDRVRVLERDGDRLKDQLTSLEQAAQATPRPPTASFTAAETILLEAIPTRIAGRCQPRRAELPKGAKAGVSCAPNSGVVASVDYYLLEGSDAAAAFQDTMETFNVPEAASASETCASSVKSQRIFIGRGWQSEGCYRTGGQAELRFVDNATDCTQLKVGSKRLKSPALYIALQGADRDVARVHQWATRSLDASSGQLTSISQPIQRPGERPSPTCPT